LTRSLSNCGIVWEVKKVDRLKGKPMLVTVRIRRFLSLALASACMSTYLSAQQESAHPGETVYQTYCAACHNGGDPRAASLQTLQSLTQETITFALTSGIMSGQGQMLSVEQRVAVIDYLAAESMVSDDWITASLCESDNRQAGLERISLAGAGADERFSRNLSAQQSGLSKTDMGNLELAWAFGLPGVSGLRSAPVITEDTIFYPAGTTGKVLALDAGSGCIRWVYDAGIALRASASLGEPQSDGIRRLIVTDELARVHAIDPSSGQAIWVVSGEVDRGVATRLTGAPLQYQDMIFVPVSASGVARGADPQHECCDGRGAVLALDALSGERRWEYVTMPPAEYTGQFNAVGVPLRGPSGAPIWSSPSLDDGRGFLYVTTGENTSLPATSTSNAIIAIDIHTGAEKWVFQAIADDVWNMACTGRNPGPNCPSADDSILKDWDFGGAAVLVDLEDGSQVLLAGQKSGHLWAVNPDDGSLLWEQRVGQGGTLGGNHWGIAADGGRVYLPINDPHYASMTDDMIHAGMYAFDSASGTPLWEYRARPDCAAGREQMVATCQEKYGFSALPLVIDGALVAGNIDGRVFIFDGVDGRILFEYDTSRPYTTINGVEARGGSIDAHSVAAGSGMLLIGSGYERFRQQAGNVLLAFRPLP
jgi:polyvinyl alcohol dehydrogenase (cytochrome)